MGTRHSKPWAPARIYSLLLFLYPAAFRLRFALEMLQVFEDSCSASGADPRFVSRMEFWYLIMRDLSRSLATTWWQVLVQPRHVALYFRWWADSFVIPFTVFGYLMAEGNLGAALVGKPVLRQLTCSESRMMVCMAGTGILIALTLALLGILSALLTARNRRAELELIKL